jgi:uncharacterized membrane protein YfcA
VLLLQVEVSVEVTILIDSVLVVTSFVAGAINSVAGGGTFFTFPALIFAGVPPVSANATSSVAVFPASFSSAFAYRKDFTHVKELPLGIAIVLSCIGGWFGATVLIATPQQTFVELIPWLLLIATLLFAYGKKVGEILRKRYRITMPLILSALLVIAFYGGYFGAGIGILTLALFGLMGMNKMNAMKTILSGFMNLAAVTNFVTNTAIDWHAVLVMATSAIIGGYLGAAIARKIDQKYIRWTVIGTGSFLTVYFFVQTFFLRKH